MKRQPSIVPSDVNGKRLKRLNTMFPGHIRTAINLNSDSMGYIDYDSPPKKLSPNIRHSYSAKSSFSQRKRPASSNKSRTIRRQKTIETQNDRFQSSASPQKKKKHYFPGLGSIENRLKDIIEVKVNGYHKHTPVSLIDIEKSDEDQIIQEHLTEMSYEKNHHDRIRQRILGKFLQKYPDRERFLSGQHIKKLKQAGGYQRQEQLFITNNNIIKKLSCPETITSSHTIVDTVCSALQTPLGGSRIENRLQQKSLIMGQSPSKERQMTETSGFSRSRHKLYKSALRNSKRSELSTNLGRPMTTMTGQMNYLRYVSDKDARKQFQQREVQRKMIDKQNGIQNTKDKILSIAKTGSKYHELINNCLDHIIEKKQSRQEY